MTLPATDFSVLGATRAQWEHWRHALGLQRDLLPVVADVTAAISERSSLKKIGKTPSHFNIHGKVVGIPDWPRRASSPAELRDWSSDPRLGIGVAARSLRAIDVDITDPTLAQHVRSLIDTFLFLEGLDENSPRRCRPNSSKFLMPVWVEGECKKHVVRCENGIVEFLGDSQMFVAVSTHEEGERYTWLGSGLVEVDGMMMPTKQAIPTLMPEQYIDLQVMLEREVGIEKATADVGGHRTDQRPVSNDLERAITLDQVDDQTVEDLRSALPCLVDEAADYGSWIRVGQALKSLEQAGAPQAVDLWMEFSALCPEQFDPIVAREKWDGFEPSTITYRTVFELAQQHGWVNPRSADAMQARVADRGVLEEERRRHQIEENVRLGEGAVRPPMAEIIDLEGALRRFVFLAEGSRVADVFNPHYDLAFADWAATHAASRVEVQQRPRTLANGKTKESPPKLVPVSQLWQCSPLRQTAICRTFKADGPTTLMDPDGRLALNSWKPFDRSLQVDDLEHAGVGLFVEQVRFLFGEETDRFLDWLAHIEQRPGVLPHTAWLHVATRFGMGRNWLASVLARVWAGSVASNLDLVDMLDSGFNGRLSRKVLATVDEIREGGRGEQWAHAERLKSLINEETRSINPKYGRRTLEFNACRWLVFSNHISALPVEDRDRRWQVVINEAVPREPSFYAALYQRLDDTRFIAAVATYLRQRDLSSFNPGSTARETDAKAAVIQASKSPIDQWVDLIVDHWPCDVAPSSLLGQVLGVAEEGGLSPAHRRALERGGIAAFAYPVRLDGQPTRMSIVRNKNLWSKREGSELKDEWARGRVALGSSIADCELRKFLLGLAADSGVTA